MMTAWVERYPEVLEAVDAIENERNKKPFIPVT